MTLDLQSLRLDLPREDPNEAAGVSRLWRVLTLLLVPLCGVLAVIHFALPPQQRAHAVSVRVQAVGFALPQQAENFAAGGWIEPAWPWPVFVSAQVEGRIESLKVIEGAEVKKGAVVATLSAALYEPEAAAAKARAEAARARVAETQARLEWLKAGSRKEEIAAAAAARDKAQAKYSRLQGGYRAEEIAKSAAMLAEARTLLDLRRAIAERSRVLLERKQASIDQCQRDEAEAQAAQCRVEAHTAELARLRAGYLPSEIAEAKAELEEAAQRLKLIEAGFRQEEISAALAALEAAKADESAAQADAALAVQRLALCTVRAPISGRVLELFASQGSLLSDGKFAICSLYDPSEMQVRVDVRQEQIGGVRLYQPCLVKVGARREQPYEGEVLRLDPQANLARDTIRVKIKLADPDEHLHKDMTATVDFLADKPAEDDTERPLLLPRSAIVARDKKDFVFVIRGGYAKQVEVTLGDTVGSGVAVKSGVVFGDLVAVSNAAQLEDGTAVSVED